MSHISVQEVKIASAPFLLVRIPSLRIRSSSRPEVFEANLKTETELWNLVVKEMWAGRKLADEHKVQPKMCQRHSRGNTYYTKYFIKT